MLLDFLNDCQCVLEDERSDLQEILRALAYKSVCVGFMPAITDDLYPVYALSCTGAVQIISPDVYIISVGAKDYWAKPYFEDIFNRFYEADEIREQFDIEIEEMILLYNSRLNNSFTLAEGINYNVVLCRITPPDGSNRYLLVVPEKTEDCWREIFEHYEIKCDIVIDSHKGMGDWFDSVPVYRVMRDTLLSELLPRYYFRGMYISAQPPHGFKLKYTIPDKIYHQGHAVRDWYKEIYEIDWYENRTCN